MLTETKLEMINKIVAEQFNWIGTRYIRVKTMRIAWLRCTVVLHLRAGW